MCDINVNHQHHVNASATYLFLYTPTISQTEYRSLRIPHFVIHKKYVQNDNVRKWRFRRPHANNTRSTKKYDYVETILIFYIFFIIQYDF